MEEHTPMSEVDLVDSLRRIGQPVDNVKLELSTRFLSHFSEQLYSSPQKAFEELISNGWDACATRIDVFLPEDLNAENAAFAVLDNGESMDSSGLKQLWQVAKSPKAGATNRINRGRAVIGKFGIGKLSTYVLASKMTHICMAPDGTIRFVTMDYPGKLGGADENDDKLVRDVSLQMYTAGWDELRALLADFPWGSLLIQIIEDRFPTAESEEGDGQDEFMTGETGFVPPGPGTWTLVLLTGLKELGRSMKAGVLKRMLRSRLPLGSGMAVYVNNEKISSSKIVKEVAKDWVIGPDLPVAEVTYRDSTDQTRTDAITVSQNPPGVDIPGLGRVTGRIRLYRERIAGGISEEVAFSHGFHVNVLGRIVNHDDPFFGLTDLSHSVWSRFRMTVRADGMDEFLTTSRESLKDLPPVRAFRDFLMRCFNVARTEYNKADKDSIHDTSDLLLRAFGPKSLSPLRDFVTATLDGDQEPIDQLIELVSTGEDGDAAAEWRQRTGSSLRESLRNVRWENRGGQTSISVFRPANSQFLLNSEHPFSLEHSSKAEKRVVEEMALVNFLADVYALDVGVPAATMRSVLAYREDLLKLRSYESRRSALLLAEMLRDSQRDGDFKKLEKAMGNALRCLGFDVVEMAASGEPEGVAYAKPIPYTDKGYLYSFTFDAKSTKKETAATNNLNHARLSLHRDDNNADYQLTVAPGFQGGRLPELNKREGVTTMLAADLAKLLRYTAEFGAIPLEKLREIFNHDNPDELSQWVDDLEGWIREKQKISMGDFIKFLVEETQGVEESLPIGMLAAVLRRNKGIKISENDIRSLALGLSVLLPELVSLDQQNIVIGVSPERLADAFKKQVESIKDI